MEHVYEEFFIAGYYIQIWEISEGSDLPYYKVKLSYDYSNFWKPQLFENPGAARLAVLNALQEFLGPTIFNQKKNEK